MTAKPEHSPEDKIKVGREICHRYSDGTYTIDSCCEYYGINSRTFNNWIKQIAEVSEAYKEAKDLVRRSRYVALKEAATLSLMKLITGFEMEETTQEGKPSTDKDGNVTIVNTKITKRKKKYAPNVAAVLSTLRSLDPTAFKEGMTQEDNEPQEFEIGGKKIKF